MRAGQALNFTAQPLAHGLVGLRTEPAGALQQAHAEQEVALGHKMCLKPVPARLGGQRRKVDVAGEVGFSRTVEHGLVPVAAHGLQRVAYPWREMPVVDEEASAAMRGDPPGDREKDGRRSLIAGRYCVLAMAGDQLGDFSDLFNAKGLPVAERRRAAASFGAKWGAGWFMLSNPVYGPSLRGTLDEIFPADRRWNDPQEGSH